MMWQQCLNHHRAYILVLSASTQAIQMCPSTLMVTSRLNCRSVVLEASSHPLGHSQGQFCGLGLDLCLEGASLGLKVPVLNFTF
jgi:hypothetical protein